MRALIGRVGPKPEAKVVAFFSFGEAPYGGRTMTRRAWRMC